MPRRHYLSRAASLCHRMWCRKFRAARASGPAARRSSPFSMMSRRPTGEARRSAPDSPLALRLPRRSPAAASRCERRLRPVWHKGALCRSSSEARGAAGLARTAARGFTRQAAPWSARRGPAQGRVEERAAPRRRSARRISPGCDSCRRSLRSHHASWPPW
jgi:hypothetical protein